MKISRCGNSYPQRHSAEPLSLSNSGRKPSIFIELSITSSNTSSKQVEGSGVERDFFLSSCPEPQPADQ